jgi:hypothetical protein
MADYNWIKEVAAKGKTGVDMATHPDYSHVGTLHVAKVIGFTPGTRRPLQVTYTHKKKDHTFNCYVTEQIKSLYLANNLSVGDIVLLSFVDGNYSGIIAVDKVYLP